MKTNLSTCRSRAIAGYLIRYNGGTSQFRSGLANSASLTGTAQTGRSGGASISASSGLTLFCAALAFAAWGVMTLGLTFVACIFVGIVAACDVTWKYSRRWLAAKRVCSWCKSWMGGNPFAKPTHGVCECCKVIELSKLANARSQELRRPTRTGTTALLLLLSAISFQLSAAPISDSTAVRAIVGEAANQGRDGMLAVAGAIRNRGTLKGVYGLKNPIADKQPAYVWQRAQSAWAMSATNDLTRGATHWENTKSFGEPRWAKSLTVTTNIGSHTFYK